MNKIAILGSTGSIGLTTLQIVRKNKKNFKIILLSTNSNVEKIFAQAKEFNVKNVIISNFKKKVFWKKKFIKHRIRIYESFFDFNKIFKF